MERKKVELKKLTEEFIKYIYKNSTKTISLNHLSKEMNLKRRLYDITNVLEGVGLLKKNDKRNEVELMPDFIEIIKKQADKIKQRQLIDDLLKEIEKKSLISKDFYGPKPGEIINIDDEIDDDARYFIKK